MIFETDIKDKFFKEESKYFDGTGPVHYNFWPGVSNNGERYRVIYEPDQNTVTFVRPDPEQSDNPIMLKTGSFVETAAKIMVFGEVDDIKGIQSPGYVECIRMLKERQIKTEEL